MTEEGSKDNKEIIEEVSEEICDHYCRLPEQYTPEEWENRSEEICINCPLDRLR